MDPALPGAYEWWYFDALSHDSRCALVVIFFLGSPMSPYYKAALSRQAPDARDWCGVFVSVHEKVQEQWRERAYAYNLYRGGAFSPARPEVVVGGSCLEAAQGQDGAWQWRLDVDEPGLWTGRTRAGLTFASPAAPPALPPIGPAAGAAHTWVCVAPVCRVEGNVTLPGGASRTFRGTGYHDHNFGRLPYQDTDTWYWGRATLRCDDGADRAGVFYFLKGRDKQEQATLLLFGPDGMPLAGTNRTAYDLTRPIRSVYGLRHAAELGVGCFGDHGDLQLCAQLHPERGAFSEGPFYRRLPLSLRARGNKGGQPVWTGTGEGIGEVFQPARLCGPIASRAMWSRMRRRRQGGRRAGSAW